MKHLKSVTCMVMFCLLLTIPSGRLFSQGDTSGGNAVQVSQVSDTNSSGSSLYTALGYGSNMMYLGSTISQDQPFGYAALTYGLNNEFFATVSAVHLGGINPFSAFYTGSLTYNHIFNSWFDISAGLYRYQVAPLLKDSLFSSFTYGDVTLGIDWRIIYTKISVGELFSDENSTYLQVKNSRYFQTPEFFNKKVNISFDPYVNILMGTLTEVITSEGTSVILSPPYRKWRQTVQGPQTTSVTKSFGVIEVDFGLPVSFNTDRLTIEAEAGYVLPVYKGESSAVQKGFLFLLSG